MREYCDYTENVSQSFDWRDGADQYSTLSISLEKKCCLEAKFSPSGCLQRLSVRGGYFALIPKYTSQLAFSIPFESGNFSDGVCLDEQLSLVSKDIQDQVVCQICNCAGFSTLKSVDILNTSISTDGFTSLMKLNNLQCVDIVDRREDMINAVKEVSQRTPDCKWYLNREFLV